MIANISIHALLAESDFLLRKDFSCLPIISIHALLAESDFFDTVQIVIVVVFLSTLSLRRATPLMPPTRQMRHYFYPRSPCGERRKQSIHHKSSQYFYPRSPCGERRRIRQRNNFQQGHFYPRSPCGERRTVARIYPRSRGISIHALLAESDDKSNKLARRKLVFLSTLSLRRATEKVPADVYYQAFLSTLSLRRATVEEVSGDTWTRDFYPRSPCGERHRNIANGQSQKNISIHALLAESDLFALLCNLLHHNFYPRSPCGERPTL